MKKDPQFLIGNDKHTVLEVITNTEPSLLPLGDTSFQELLPTMTEGAAEKHLPVIEKNGSRVTVKVGSVFHPMSEEHSIEWVYLQTEKSCQRICLSPDGEPTATFELTDGDRPVAAYAYCNLHGFWKSVYKGD